LAASVGLGLALRFLVPVPVGITMQAWTLLSIFVSAIAGARRRPALAVASVVTFCCTVKGTDFQLFAAQPDRVVSFSGISNKLYAKAQKW
jgi:DASS family divalent anion:Na+ symporter